MTEGSQRRRYGRRAVLAGVGTTVVGAGTVAADQETATTARGERVWPVDTNASDGVCLSANDEESPASGEGSAAWFDYGGCGSWKEFEVESGRSYRVVSRTDQGVLTDAAHEIQERVDGEWETKRRVEDPLGPDARRTQEYTPETGRLRVVNVDGGSGTGFYLELYALPEAGGDGGLGLGLVPAGVGAVCAALGARVLSRSERSRR